MIITLPDDRRPQKGFLPAADLLSADCLRGETWVTSSRRTWHATGGAFDEERRAGVIVTVLAVGWVVTGLVVVVAGFAAGRRPRALVVGLGATAFAMAGLGALGNAVLVASGFDFTTAAQASYSAWVRDSLGPAGSTQATLFAALLIAFQATAGLVILFGGRWVEVGLAAAVVFQLGLMAYGWWYYLTSPIMIIALLLLWRAARRGRLRPLYVPDILQAREADRRR